MLTLLGVVRLKHTHSSITTDSIYIQSMEEQKSLPSPQLGVAAEAISTQHDHLLNEVEAAEGQLGAILR